MIRWLSDDRFVVDGVEFVDTFRPGSTAERFHIRKRRDLVEAYVDVLAAHRGARVAELGIAFGGSVALMELVARPELLIALELDPTPVAGLADLIERRGIGDRVRPHYGVNQADRQLVADIALAELDGARLDLVIDDASHLLGPTRASFEALFPLLRTGGTYRIEDWNWQHKMSEHMAAALRAGDPEALAALATHREQLEPGSPEHERFRRAVARRQGGRDPASLDRLEAELRRRADEPDIRAALEAAVRAAPDAAIEPDAAAAAATTRRQSAAAKDGAEPLAALVIELVLARAWSGDVVADVHVDEFWITVTRGPAELDPRSFRLDDTSTDTFGLRWRP